MSRPWLKWCPKDWANDKALRLCSLSVRGLWHELCLIAHDCEPYGHVLPDGSVPTVEELAILVGASASQVAACLAELERRKVFSRGSLGEIVSRRMVRDERARVQAEKDGKKGGNPNLRRQPTPKAQAKAMDNPPANADDKSRARSDSDSSSLTDSSFLQGTSPGGDAAPGKPPPPPPPAKRAPAKGEHPELVRHWEAEWLATRGAPWAIAPLDASKLASLLKRAQSLEAAKKAVTVALQSQEEFWLKAASPANVETQFNQLVAQPINGVAKKTRPQTARDLVFNSPEWKAANGY